MKPFSKVLIWYVVLQLMFVPFAMSIGYNFELLPEGGHAWVLGFIQLLIALYCIVLYFTYDEIYRKEREKEKGQ